MGAVHPPNHGGMGQKFQTAALPQVASVSQTKLHHGPSCAPNPNIVYIIIYIGLQKMKRKKAGSWDCHCQTLWVNTSTDCGALLSDYPHRPTCRHGFWSYDCITPSMLPMFLCTNWRMHYNYTRPIWANIEKPKETQQTSKKEQTKAGSGTVPYSCLHLDFPRSSQHRMKGRSLQLQTLGLEREVVTCPNGKWKMEKIHRKRLTD